jgi:hypothetical protein
MVSRKDHGLLRRIKSSLIISIYMVMEIGELFPRMLGYKDVVRVVVSGGPTISDQILSVEDSLLKKKKPLFNYTASWETSGLRLRLVCLEEQTTRSKTIGTLTSEKDF